MKNNIKVPQPFFKTIIEGIVNHPMPVCSDVLIGRKAFRANLKKVTEQVADAEKQGLEGMLYRHENEVLVIINRGKTAEANIFVQGE